MDRLNIVVCAKQTPDPEAPISGYRIDSEARRVIPVGVPPVISPFDENALELALRLKERTGAKVTALSVGYNLSRAVLRKALFVGADELILADDAALDPEKVDSRAIAWTLSEAIKKMDSFHLILTGRQASDTNAGVVGIYLAELLGIPAVTLARELVLQEGKARIERALPDGLETVETELPAVVTVSSEAGELRSLNMKEMREAKKKPIVAWTAMDLPLDRIPAKVMNLRRLCAPERERTCLFIEAESPAEAGEKLALRLREDNLI